MRSAKPLHGCNPSGQPTEPNASERTRILEWDCGANLRREEFEELVRRGRARHRSSSYVVLENEVLAEKDNADLLVDGQARTIEVQRLVLCANGHVVARSNAVVAKCGICGRNLCAACKPKTCEICGITVGPCHYSSIKDEFFCSRHRLGRYIRLVLGF